jgi:hypothetical protein
MNDLKENTDLPKEESLTRTRAKLSFLFLMSVAPFALAYVFFFVTPDWIPSGTTNQGELILPPVQASEAGIDHKALFDGDLWILVIPVGSSCDAGCVEALYLSRQVKIALGKESNRIERVVLSSASSLTAEFVALLSDEHQYAQLVFNSGPPINDLISPVLGRTPMGSYILLMDPNGNIMMFYTLEKAGKPMLKDIKLLLKASNIG